MTLDEVRTHIDSIDEQIIMLLAARQALVKEAAHYKTDTLAVQAPERRVAMMRHRHDLADQAGVSPDVVRVVFTAMIDAFIDLELQEHAALPENRA